MATQTARNLKQEFVDMSDKCFEPLIFGELKEAQKFIALPLPGDNHGHGGFRKAHWLFEKIKKHVEEASAGMSYSEDNPHGVAINITTQTESNFPLSMHVILVE